VRYFPSLTTLVTPGPATAGLYTQLIEGDREIHLTSLAGFTYVSPFLDVALQDGSPWLDVWLRWTAKACLYKTFVMHTIHGWNIQWPTGRMQQR